MIIMTSQLAMESKKDINIDLSKDSRQGVIQILNKRLCDEYILFTKTRHYHWNVVGPNFSERHKFFQEQYEQIDEIIDEIAERDALLMADHLVLLLKL